MKLAPTTDMGNTVSTVVTDMEKNTAMVTAMILNLKKTTFHPIIKLIIKYEY